MPTTLLWFRQDLRISDHLALNAAANSGADVLCCYVHDTVSDPQWSMGSASQWWLHHALVDLREQLAERGGHLILRRGDTVEALAKLVEECNADALYFSRNYEPAMRSIENKLQAKLTEQGIDVKRFGGNLLFDPTVIKNKSDLPFKVFTPFWKHCLQQSAPALPRRVPKSLVFSQAEVHSDRLIDWDLLPTRPNWAGGLREEWQPNVHGAHLALGSFLDGYIGKYKKQRDVPGVQGTSRLSPFLHFGQISPAQVWHETHLHLSANVGDTQGADTFLSELGWREFSYHLLHHFPDLPEKPFRKNFAQFPWAPNDELLRQWQRGMTGFPFIDAGMRELWHTGWMHNRVRMVVASFLVKDLLIPWQDGEAWFWDTLVDADLASNSASWQWVAGCGADAAPYFRIFNPILQGEKFDADGSYVRKWIPELAALPDKWIHKPDQAPDDVLEAAGIKRGVTYPLPVIDRKVSRQRALDAFQVVKAIA